jgi:hypothetical protein
MKLKCQAIFTIVVIIHITHPHWSRVVGYGPFSLCVIHKEGLCPSSGGINGLMIMIPLTHYPRKDSRGTSDIPPKRPRLTKII